MFRSRTTLLLHPAASPTLDFVRSQLSKNGQAMSNKLTSVPRPVIDASKSRSSSSLGACMFHQHAGEVSITESTRLRIMKTLPISKLTSTSNNSDEAENVPLPVDDASSLTNYLEVCRSNTPMCIHRSASSFLPISRTNLHRNMWEQECSAGGAAAFGGAVPLEVFEGNAKDHWIDGKRGWCYLCQEPVGTSAGTHIGDRDHANMCAYLYLYSLYPRTWSTKEIICDSLERYPQLASHIFGIPHSQDHLHTLDDVDRRLEIEAMLLHVTQPPHNALTHTLTQNAPIALWVSGERIFKINMSRLVATMVPPMAAGVHTAFTQKIWSRSNMERMYDALNIGRIHAAHGVEPKKGKLDKAFFMRTMMWELHVAKDGIRDLENVNNNSSNVAGGGDLVVQEVTTGDSDFLSSLNSAAAIDNNTSYTTQVLVEELLRKIAFELMYLQTMQYMNRVQDVVRKCNVPSWLELGLLDSL